jgi:hypothetical protein
MSKVRPGWDPRVRQGGSGRQKGRVWTLAAPGSCAGLQIPSACVDTRGPTGSCAGLQIPSVSVDTREPRLVRRHANPTVALAWVSCGELYAP